MRVRSLWKLCVRAHAHSLEETLIAGDWGFWKPTWANNTIRGMIFKSNGCTVKKSWSSTKKYVPVLAISEKVFKTIEINCLGDNYTNAEHKK